MSNAPIRSPLDASVFARRLAAATSTIDESNVPSTLPCSPWDRWVLVALHRHSIRQRFVEQVVRERLSGSPEAIGLAGAFEHPEQAVGVVPGMPTWRFRFHGTGCCLIHEDGAEIDVDFDEHGSSSIDPWFFDGYLQTDPKLGWVERQLRRTTDPGEPGWKASIQPLCDALLLEGNHRVRVAATAQEWCEAVSQAIDQNGHPEREPGWIRAIAVALEDYPRVAALDGSAGSASIRAAAAEQLAVSCADLEARLVGRIGVHTQHCLSALRARAPDRARAVALTDVERGPVDGVLSSSLQLLVDDPRLGDTAAIRGLFTRLQGTQPPTPWIRVLAAQRLISPFRRGEVPDDLQRFLFDALRDDQRSCEADAAFVIYLLDRSRGLSRLLAGLDSPVPLARDQCAAALGLVGSADALEILRRVGSPEASAVLALLRGDSPEPGPEPRGETIDWFGRAKTVYTIAELLDADFEQRVFGIAESFWAKHLPLLQRWEAA